MQNYLLLRYNNYYNRIFKREEDISAYMEYAVTPMQTDIDFQPGDYVSTSIIVDFELSSKQADYFILIDQDNQILSRWFIIDNQRTTGGQYKLNLYRDVVADYFNNLLNAPMFVEKGPLPSTDPMIFNSENMTYNQIKKSETLLQDKTKTPWIVGYYAKDLTEGQMKGTIKTNASGDIGATPIGTTIEKWKYFKYTGNQEIFKSQPFDMRYKFNYRIYNISDGKYRYASYLSDGNLSNAGRSNNYSELKISAADHRTLLSELSANIKTHGTDALRVKAIEYLNWTTYNDTVEFLNLKDKLIVDTNGKYYQVNIIQLDNGYQNSNAGLGKLYQEDFKQIFEGTGLSGTPASGDIQIDLYFNQYRLELSERTDLEATYDLTSHLKLITEDAPYNIFAIPYGKVKFVFYSPGQPVPTISYSNKEIALSAVSAIIKDNPGVVYDVQLLPYCPVQEWLTSDGSVKIYNNNQYSEIQQGSEPIGYILNVPKSQFSFNIFLDKPIRIKDTKIESECDIYRVVSPNYNGQFEFSAAKNGGVEYFNVDCTYKPFAPYIHLNPNFERLYGRDFDDARGLICGGDFSLAIITDQWRQYELNNKNYLNSFNRQIENMEVHQKYERLNDILGASIGALQGGAIAAGGVGLLGGGPIAKGVAGTFGMAASAAAGIADVAIKDKLRNEAIDFTKDQFGFQLQNIQALPYSLNRVSSLTANNKYFPFLEYYSCSEEEKTALKNKIKYNGMTVGRIGSISEFIGYKTEDLTYIKGKVIRLDNLEEDSHMANAIADELNKGVYF